MKFVLTTTTSYELIQLFLSNEFLHLFKSFNGLATRWLAGFRALAFPEKGSIQKVTLQRS
jgi:hypothetical protein